MSYVAKIRGFLLLHPKPAAVRVTGDGEPETLKPGKSYVKCAETINALNVELIECLDSKGELIRAMRLSDEEAHRTEAAPIPEGLKSDPHALMLTHFANLLHRAYEHSTEIAFTKMVELADKMNARAESIEQRLERTEAMNRRMLQESAEDAIERAEEAAEEAIAKAASGGTGNPFIDQMASAFVSGQLQNGAARAAKTSNGHGGAK